VITIYSAEWCGYCTKAKEYLSAQNREFNVIDVEVVEELSDEFNMAGTLPQIFVDGKFIGGYTELVKEYPL
jgi:glutaredoxin